MNARQPNNPQASIKEAAQWFAQLTSEDCQEKDLHAWRLWLEADERNRYAWGRVETVLHKVSAAQDLRLIPQISNTLNRQNAKANSKRRVLLSSLGIVMTGGLCWRLLPHDTYRNVRLELADRMPDIATTVARRSKLTLPDNSVLHVNAASRVTELYSADQRLIVLGLGELHLITQQDTIQPARPLSVWTKHAEFVALGTEYSVKTNPHGTQVHVFAGQVDVRLKHGSNNKIEAGQSLFIGPNGSTQIGTAKVWRKSWVDGWLQAELMRLDELALELSDFSGIPIEVSPLLRGREIVGLFRLDSAPNRVRDILALLQREIHFTIKVDKSGTIILL